MNIHILGVGSVGTLLAFHIQRAIRSSKSISAASAYNNVADSTSKSNAFPLSLSSQFWNNASLTLHMRRSSFPSSTQTIQNRSTNHPSAQVSVETNGITQTESGLKVEYLPFIDQMSDQTFRRLRQSHVDKRKDEIETDWKKLLESKKKKRAHLHYLDDHQDLKAMKDDFFNKRHERLANIESDFRVQFIEPPANETVSPAESQLPIPFLIITTKADATVSAIGPLLYRLNESSTILLLQNGMGVMDELVQTFFRDIKTRPQFILGITTHGVWRKKGCHVVHAGVGNVDLAVVPGTRSLGLENGALQRLLGEGAVEARSASGLNNGVFSESDLVDRSHQPGMQARPRDISSHRNSQAENQGRYQLAQFLSLLQTLPLSISLHPYSSFQLKSLQKLIVNSCINPLTSILNIKNGGLINGGDDGHSREIIRGVCEEAEEILMEMAKRRLRSEIDASREQKTERMSQGSGSQNEDIDVENVDQMDLLTLAFTRKPSNASDLQGVADTVSNLNPPGEISGPLSAIDNSLLATSLIEQVERIATLTSENWSSMAQDLGINPPPISPSTSLISRSNAESSEAKGNSKRKGRGRDSTEIAYINGYIVALGKLHGVKTPVNEMLTRLVKAKSAMRRGKAFGAMGR